MNTFFCRFLFSAVLVLGIFPVLDPTLPAARPKARESQVQEPQSGAQDVAQAAPSQTAETKKADPHRTEPEESEVSDREKRELEIRSEQTIGKVLVAPDGSFFLYEWRRPYSWDKDFGALPKSVSDHMQSWIYRVDPELSATDSKYLFLYESGASQWLGSLSPNSKLVSFYSLDDDNKLKTGVWDFAKTKITWFTASPDERHLDQSPVWTSNAELIYPGRAGKFVRASVTTGKAAPCDACKAIYEKGRTMPPSLAHEKIPNDLGTDGKILAHSRAGQLSVYERRTPHALALLYQKGTEKTETVFENSRLGSGPPPEGDKGTSANAH